MHDFRKLGVWKKSRVLVKEIYLVVNQFPKVEMFGLTSQMKRCAVSIPSNIAEGCGRNSNKQYAYHLNVALGSAFELETQILIGSDLEYMSLEKGDQLVIQTQEVIRMLIGLTKSIK